MDKAAQIHDRVLEDACSEALSMLAHQVTGQEAAVAAAHDSYAIRVHQACAGTRRCLFFAACNTVMPFFEEQWPPLNTLSSGAPFATAVSRAVMQSSTSSVPMLPGSAWTLSSPKPREPLPQRSHVKARHNNL